MAELDHIFICVPQGAVEASNTLTAFGLSEGKPNEHPGQGTACRRFSFHNGYIELLWVSSEAEAQSEAIQPTHLWEHWAGQRGMPIRFWVSTRYGP
jgi:Glyoxalase-like domain